VCAQSSVLGTCVPLFDRLGSQSLVAHDAFDEEGAEYVAASADSAACGLLDAGEAALYDGRVLHSGGPNSSPERRVQFYATFRRAAADGVGLGNEAAHSLLDEYKGKHTLGQLLDEAEAWAEGGERKSSVLMPRGSDSKIGSCT